MGFNYDSTDLDVSKVLKADHVNSAVESIETFVNQGIGGDELKNSVAVDDPANPYERIGFVDPNIIYRPEFYGSPSPRMMAVSGQTHFRESPYSWPETALFSLDVSGRGFTGVPGMSTRIKLRHDATVDVICSYYAFEFGGVARSETGGFNTKPTGGFPQAETGYESLPAADMRLMVNGSTYASTNRTVFTSLVNPKRSISTGFEVGTNANRYYQHVNNGFLWFPLIGRKLVHCVLQVELSEGVHDIGLALRPRIPLEEQIVLAHESIISPQEVREKIGFSEDDLPKFPRMKHIYIVSRNFIVDCYYKDNDPL
tara:strand:- start:324 stop:1262 length:939 start_codon:yes stop_codon:yes gene_type:complete